MNPEDWGADLINRARRNAQKHEDAQKPDSTVFYIHLVSIILVVILSAVVYKKYTADPSRDIAIRILAACACLFIISVLALVLLRKDFFRWKGVVFVVSIVITSFIASFVKNSYDNLYKENKFKAFLSMSGISVTALVLCFLVNYFFM